MLRLGLECPLSRRLGKAGSSLPGGPPSSHPAHQARPLRLTVPLAPPSGDQAQVAASFLPAHHCTQHTPLGRASSGSLLPGSASTYPSISDLCRTPAVMQPPGPHPPGCPLPSSLLPHCLPGPWGSGRALALSSRAPAGGPHQASGEWPAPLVGALGGAGIHLQGKPPGAWPGLQDRPRPPHPPLPPFPL